MQKYLNTLYLFIGLFIVIGIINYIINKRKLTNKKSKKKNKKIKTIGEIDYLVNKFKLDRNKITNKNTIIWIAIINSFIISFTSCLIMLIPLKLMWQLLIAFVILFSLIYALYEIYGRHLKNKEIRESESK